MSALRTVLATTLTATVLVGGALLGTPGTEAGPVKEVVHSVRGGGDGGGWCC